MTVTSPAKIARAVKYVAFAKKNPNDVDHVNFYLGEGEKITQADLTNFHAAAQDATATNVAVEDAAPADEIAQEAPEAEAPTLSITEAKSKLLESQILFRGATDAQRLARARLGRSIAGWQAALGVIVTAEQNARAHIASENEQRRLRAEGKLPSRGGRARPGPSVIDAIAAGSAGAVYGNRGGAFAFKRGATDIATSQRKLNAMVAAQPKPPG